MFLSFTTIDDWQEPPDELEFVSLPANFSYRSRPFSFEEQFFYCECGHAWYSHQLGEGKCDCNYFGECLCKAVVFSQADMEITFTTADVFELEITNHSERDSPQWWIEFGEWYELQNKTNL